MSELAGDDSIGTQTRPRDAALLLDLSQSEVAWPAPCGAFTVPASTRDRQLAVPIGCEMIAKVRGA